MKKLIVFALALAVCAAAPAGVITSVVRADGQPVAGTSTANWLQTVPPSSFDGSTAPLATEAGGLIVGNKVFSDRAVHNWSSVPLALNRSEYVRTFNTDKSRLELEVTYTITISEAATVWLTIDDRATTATATGTSGWGTTVPWYGFQPASLQAVADWVTQLIGPAGTFTDTGLDLLIYESSTVTGRVMSVYSANLAAGTYTFGALPHGSLNFYTIGVVPEPATMVLLGLGGLLLRKRR